jgi:thiamine biosynthesis lipoprotein
VSADLLDHPARHHRFTALGTYVHLSTSGDLGRAVELAEAVLAEVDRACSRFRADSDLVLANARAGRWTYVDPLLAAAVAVALDAATESDGLVDPCLGRPLVEIGYDGDLATVRARPDVGVVPATSARPDAWREVRTDADGAVFVPKGVALDLGATAKAWAADLLALSLAEALHAEVLVSLGGDLRVAGPDGDPSTRAWPVIITEHPDGVGDDLDPVMVGLDGGGLATSSTLVRRWRAGGVVQHHLLDPRTGRPVTPYWRTVTATGPTCVAANVASTAAIVLGVDAEAWLSDRGVDARLVGTDGDVRRTGRWPGAEGMEA